MKGMCVARCRTLVTGRGDLIVVWAEKTFGWWLIVRHWHLFVHLKLRRIKLTLCIAVRVCYLDILTKRRIASVNTADDDIAKCSR